MVREIRTKADLIRDLEEYDDDALIYYDEETAQWYGSNYLFNVQNPTPLEDAETGEKSTDWVQIYSK